jgi:spermidine synthase
LPRRSFLAACGFAALGLAPRTRAADAPPASAEEASEEERVLERGVSEYNHVVVTQQGTVRRMYFESDGQRMLQTTYDLARPHALHHAVFQTMVAGLLLQPQPRRMCMIGLGGGQLSNYLFHHLPDLQLDVVEICPEVVRLAHKYFDVPADPRYRVHVSDGRVFIESLARSSVDLLVHDAYRGHSIPRHLRSLEFHQACVARLTAHGGLVANMHRRAPRYPVDRATMAAAYRHVYRFASADDLETTVVGSMAPEVVTPERLEATARALQPRFDFDLVGLAGRSRVDETGWPAERIVHDDFDDATLDDAARRHNLSCAPRCADDD